MKILQKLLQYSKSVLYGNIYLTHCDPVMEYNMTINITKFWLVNIGSDNDLGLGTEQASSHYMNQWYVVHWTLRNKF